MTHIPVCLRARVAVSRMDAFVCVALKKINASNFFSNFLLKLSQSKLSSSLMGFSIKILRFVYLVSNPALPKRNLISEGRD